MVNNVYFKPIGTILQEACLISTAQLEVALYDLHYHQDLRLGEILALRGWIKQDTADFFAEQWRNLIQEQSIKKPIGYYLHQAALLNEADIQSILKEQKIIWMRFGSIAVLQGLIKQETLEFFLKTLFPEKYNISPFIGRKELNDNCPINTHKQKVFSEQNETEIDDEDIPWID